DNNPAAINPFIVRGGFLVRPGTPAGTSLPTRFIKTTDWKSNTRFAAKPGNCGVHSHIRHVHIIRCFPSHFGSAGYV
ncbi:MAG: hypothetical protein U5K79_22035, partial [Cyclobacteriaceae bacterium]|nr:hypothetical protein [Cyclobacteriaceae bacterium]